MELTEFKGISLKKYPMSLRSSATTAKSINSRLKNPDFSQLPVAHPRW